LSFLRTINLKAVLPVEPKHNTIQNPAIEQAMAAVAAAVPKAQSDPRRPRYHFLPPANWMNDPNGTIYHNGFYHVFYQHNPYADHWDHMHWGHARSRDLVHWEHLPIALWPSQEQGEAHCFSGCATVTEEGQPLLIYTSVAAGSREERPANEQWGALGDADWITWTKHPQNPLLSLETHGGPAFGGEWRDPYVFHADGRTLLVVAGAFEDTAAVALYEAQDGTLARWHYRKLLYTEPRRQTRFLECPNFFQVGDRWVLLTSPYRPVEYVTGDFDTDTLTFTPQRRGVLDPGYNELATANFYATNTLYAPDGRCILLGWVRGFAPGRGWNGYLAVPRVLTIDSNYQPCQEPIEELKQLRGAHHSTRDQMLDNNAITVDRVAHPSVEILLTLDPGDAAQSGLRFVPVDSAEQPVTILFNRQVLLVNGVGVPYDWSPGESIQLRLFLDGAGLELFADDGRVAVTHAVDLPIGGMDIEVFAPNGKAALIAYDRWEMKSIW